MCWSFLIILVSFSWFSHAPLAYTSRMCSCVCLCFNRNSIRKLARVFQSRLNLKSTCVKEASMNGLQFVDPLIWVVSKLYQFFKILRESIWFKNNGCFVFHSWILCLLCHFWHFRKSEARSLGGTECKIHGRLEWAFGWVAHLLVHVFSLHAVGPLLWDSNEAVAMDVVHMNNGATMNGLRRQLDDDSSGVWNRECLHSCVNVFVTPALVNPEVSQVVSYANECVYVFNWSCIGGDLF